MKTKLLSMGILALALVFGIISCGGDDSGSDLGIYKGFYNYPDGRKDGNGLLTIQNTANAESLLFEGTVGKDHYIGTVGALSSIKVTMPEEKFYSIVAVQKSNYEEQGDKAEQFNRTAYYAADRGITIEVSPTSNSGAGNWIVNNNTSYWVELQRPDRSSNYTGIQPNAQRIRVPINIDQIYDYHIVLTREIKYNGKIMAKLGVTDPAQSNSFSVSADFPTYTTTITNATTLHTKPAVLVKNDSAKGVRVYRANQQMTNAEADLVVSTGKRQLIAGFEVNDRTNVIKFSALAWGSNDRVVPVDMPMLADKVYVITIPSNENAADITVVEEDGSAYYD